VVQHPVEVAAHRRERLVVAGHHIRVPDADAEDEASVVGVVQHVRTRGQCLRLACPDVRDPAGDGDPLGRAEDDAAVGEDLLVALGDPECRIAQRLDLLGDITFPRGGQPTQRTQPRPDPAQACTDGVPIDTTIIDVRHVPNIAHVRSGS